LKVIPTRADDRALTQIAERAGNRLAPIVLTTVNTVPTGNGLVPRAVSTKCASGLIATVVAEIWSACTWTVSTLQR